MSRIVPLETLSAGEEATVSDLCGPAESVNRLQEMGLRPGRPVRMIQPGRPCIVALGDQRLSLRTEEDLLILVEIEPN